MEKETNNFINLKSSQAASSSKVKVDYSGKTVRKAIDDENKRNAIRDQELFKNKKTVKDPYTEKVLHQNQEAAKAKYGEKNKTSHIGQMDHTIPLEKIYNASKLNPYLNEEAIKRIANISENYKFINARLNMSKGSMTNLEYIFKHSDEMSRKQAMKMLEADFTARIAVGTQYIKETVKGIGKEGANGAVTAAKYEAIISGFTHFKKIIDGEETSKEGLINVAKDTTSAMATGGAMSIVTKGVEQTTLQFAYKMNDKVLARALNTLCESGNIGKIIVATKEIGSSIVKYINDDISVEELILEMGEKGTGFATSLAIGSEGAFVGAILGSIIGGLLVPPAGALVGGKVGFVAGEFLGNIIGYSVGTKLFDYITFISKQDGLAFQHYENVKKEQEEIRQLLDQIQDNISHEMKILNLKSQVYDNCLKELSNKYNDSLFYDALDTISLLSGNNNSKLSKKEFYEIMSDSTKKFKL